jgi:alpha-amylase/alpha-mannosidase (GH57 family)
MERYVCIHGHFYQPPRENAWLEYVEWQDSAYPYHDWNERITAECYMPNTSSRILDKNGFIGRIVSNYARMSFDFGPTLLDWMEKNNPEVYREIIEADKQSRVTFSGHGSAMAQAYNHIIMPLANYRDRYSQVLWGISDFEHRFGRKPEGMWLPETAVDLESLDIMAEMGIRFTVLAQHQAARVRQIDNQNWKNVPDASIDPTRAYAVNLPSGRKINVFFYDGPISHDVAFNDVLKNGDGFIKRLTAAFSDKRKQPQLVHIATDGETYGHHHRFADMALAYVLHRIEEEFPVKITNYGEFLEKYPPTHEVEISEKTSWSCVHGVDRWWSDCGDTTGSGNHPEWNQEWRTPLRNAFDFLRDTLAPKYEEKAGMFFKDGWAARNGYIDVILDRSPGSRDRFFNAYASRELNDDEKITALKLLELQRHTMLMYTSCGWFFDEISRPEPVQVIQYAGRVVQLANELFGENIEEDFLKILEKARSNIPEQGTGRNIYEHLVKPSVTDLTRVAAHYAVSSLFSEYSAENDVFCYTVKNEDHRVADCGEARLETGRARVTSKITEETGIYTYGVFNPGNSDISAGVSPDPGGEAYQKMSQELSPVCAAADNAGVMQILEGNLGGVRYSLKSLFRDEQRRVLRNILESTMSGMEKAYRQLFEHHYTPVRFLSELGGPIPHVFHVTAELIINLNLHQAVQSEVIDAETVKSMVAAAAKWQVELDDDGIAYDLKNTLEKMIATLAAGPTDAGNLKGVLAAVAMAKNLPFPVDMWQVQNIFWNINTANYTKIAAEAAKGDPQAKARAEDFIALGKLLSIDVA